MKNLLMIVMLLAISGCAVIIGSEELEVIVAPSFSADGVEKAE